MGLVKLFAKLGAPGRMTKTVIHGYRAFKSKYPDMSDNDIYHEIIKVRYIKPQDKDIYDEVAIKIGSYRSLFDLVFEMLLYESRDFATMPRENQVPIIEAVKDVLQCEGFSRD